MLADDVAAGKGLLLPRQSDTATFKLGKNLATTPGKVVFQNELCQVIQYAQTADSVWKRPLLIVPPWINKFYVLDLTPEKSLIRWLVEQGHTVFVVSWVNPDERHAEKGFAALHGEGHPRRARRGREGDRREEGQRRRLLRRRHAARHHARLPGRHRRRTHRQRHAAHRAGRFRVLRRPQGLRRRRPYRERRGGDEEDRLSRRLEDGDRLQSPALERPDLALRRERLSEGQGAAPLRPPLLERRRDAHAVRQTIRSICATATWRTTSARAG